MFKQEHINCRALNNFVIFTLADTYGSKVSRDFADARRDYQMQTFDRYRTQPTWQSCMNIIVNYMPEPLVMEFMRKHISKEDENQVLIFSY